MTNVKCSAVAKAIADGSLALPRDLWGDLSTTISAVAAQFVNLGSTVSRIFDEIEETWRRAVDQEKIIEEVRRIIQDPKTLIKSLNMTSHMNGTVEVDISAVTTAPAPSADPMERKIRATMDNKLGRHIASARMGMAYEWDKWTNLIPELEFPPHWKVRIVPPTVGAIVRFRVASPKGDISVYMDGYGDLGHYGTREEGGKDWVAGVLQGHELPDTDAEPYWEIYPIEGDTHRCALHATDELIRVIDEEIARQKN